MTYMTLMLNVYGLFKWSHSALEHINCTVPCLVLKNRVYKNSHYSKISLIQLIYTEKKCNWVGSLFLQVY